MNSGACKSERQSQTTEQMDQLEKGIHELSESVGFLVGRLGKALRTPTPIGTGEECEPADDLVSIAATIQQLKYRVSNINNEVQDILNRLEL